jgi:hypothetical protein
MEFNLGLIGVSAFGGAVLWHFIHTKVAADIAALKTDVANLKASIGLGTPVAAATTAVPATTIIKPAA